MVLTREKIKPQIKAPRVTPLEGVSTYAPQGIRVCGVEGTQSCASGGRLHVCPARAYVLFGSREPLGFGLENPQGFGIDERRLIDSQRLFPCLLSEIGNVIAQRLRTRMTQIRRIFMDTIYSFVSAFICVHLRFEFTGGTT